MSLNCGMKMEYLEETSAGRSYHAYSTEKGSSEPGTMNQNLTGGVTVLTARSTVCGC